MTKDLLPVALGNILCSLEGLNYFSVPKDISTKFVSKIVETVNEKHSYKRAFHVSRYSNGESVSPEYATSLRSRENGDSANALIVSLDGEFKDLKSLEAFIHVNPLQLPAGVSDINQASISLSEISQALAKEVAHKVQPVPSLERDSFLTNLEVSLSKALKYLGYVYRDYGNHEISWKDAWWLHANFLADRLIDTCNSFLSNGNYNELAVLRVTCMAAGIPSPTEVWDQLYSTPKHSHTRYCKQVQEYWQNGDDAVTALFEMKKVAIKREQLASDSTYPLSELDWSDGYDTTLANTGHPVLSLSIHGNDVDNHKSLWGEVNEDHFFDFIVQQLDVAIFNENTSGEIRELYQVGFLNEPTFILYCERVNISEDGKWLKLGKYCLLIREAWGTLQRSDIQLSASPKALDVQDIGFRPSNCGNTLLEIELFLRLPSTGKGKWKEKPYKLMIEPSVNQGTIKFSKPSQLNLLLAFPGDASTFYISSKKNKPNEKRKLEAPGDREFYVDTERQALLLSEDSFSQRVEIKQDAISADVILVSANHNLKVGVEEKKSSVSESWPAIKQIDDLRVPDGSTLTAGSNQLEIGVAESSNRPLSPIIASAMGVLPSDDESGGTLNRLLGDIRGFYESWVKDFYLDPSKVDRTSLAQVYAFEDIHQRVDKVRFDNQSGFYVAHDDEIYLQDTISSESSLGVANFWEAFDNLELKELGSGRVGHTSSWPSRLDLRGLAKAKVQKYLYAYHQLLEIAQESHENYYLAYPFSVVIRSGASGDNVGAMLSPLHPIRFAWAWSVQNSAEQLNQNSDIDASALLHFVDGANIPSCGPIPFGFNDLMVSIPMEPGDEDVFVAWSFLFNSKSVDVNQKLPSYISGFRIPSAARSGLDRGGVSSAINDFMRVYPYSSDLRLGLYSQQDVQRSKELDRAVVAELDILMKGRVNQLPGGIRVLDSQTRLGLPPSKREILSKLSKAKDMLAISEEKNDQKIPFTWRRGSEQSVDIRFMEESLVRVNHSCGSRSFHKSGVITGIPLKRAFAWSEPAKSKGKVSGFNPTIMPDQNSSLPEFMTSLHLLETMRGELDVTCNVPQGTGLTTNLVKWTVAGNTYLDPKLLSKALSDMAGDKVLWEWRPQFLPRRSQRISLSTSRPYTVIAALTNDFKSQLHKELKSSLDYESENSIDKVFSVLGQRGVGIASLLSMGHQHSRGAVGFFLGFLLASKWESEAKEEELRVVLPLDAVNPVFEAISGNTNDDRKKADLLLINAAKVDKTQEFMVELQPVEIKMHSAASTQHPFPKADASEVKKAIAQVSNTTKTLEGFVDKVTSLRQSGLLQAAITSLFETGLNLSNLPRTNAEKCRDLLVSAATGNCKFKVKKGVLLWFERHGYGHVGNHYIYRDISSDAASLFFVDPALLHKELISSDSGELIDKFLGLFEPRSTKNSTSHPLRDEQHERQPENDELHTGSTASTGNEGIEKTDTISASKNKTKIEDTESVLDSADKTDPAKREKLFKDLELIISTLDELGVSTYMPDDDQPFIEGPASVMYKLKPSPGVSINAIRNKLSDIHLALGLSRTQVLREFSDRGCFVIDTPKDHSDRYFIKAQELWQRWLKPAGELSVPIGVNAYNEIEEIVFSNSLTPHLLIAGTTGSGKSEALNVILKGLSNFYHETELKFMLVDPKRVELIAFRNDVHLDGEIGVNADDAINILERAVDEMEERYGLFAEEAVKNLAEYNQTVDEQKQLPWWIIVLDEYADLTNDKASKKLIEASLQRLAQKARAAGIHLIIATQKPIVDVINTVVRSNLPAQLALKVNKSSESQIIIDQNGAEALSGMGDALLNRGGELTRLQCAYFA